MKKLNLFTLMIAGLLAFASCEEGSVGPKLNTNVEPPAFTNPQDGQSFVLSEDNADGTAFELTWSEPGLGFRTEVTYIVEMAEPGTDFAESVELVETTATSLEMNVGELNTMLVDAGFEAETENSIDFRVMADINDYPNDYDEEDYKRDMVSQPITLMITPYPADVSLPDLMNLYLVGDATAAGWSNDNNNTPLVRLPDSDENNFTFTGRFAGGVEFKLLEVLGQWQPQWGDDGGALASSTDLGGDPAALTVTGDGYYTVDIDIAARSYSITPYDASGATTYTTIGIIGDATPGSWDSDTEMTQSAFDSHIWYLNNVNLQNGFLKFRADNAWDINWGSDTEFSGFGTQDGPNIPVTKGTYNVWFNDLTGGYMLIPVQ